MENRVIHVCREQDDAPARDAEYADGTRWVCSCGCHFVYRAGFTRSGQRGMDWWEAPAVTIPAPRRSRPSLRVRLVHPLQRS
jgi:hypothetical protein